jgi:hypothetical protein
MQRLTHSLYKQIIRKRNVMKNALDKLSMRVSTSPRLGRLTKSEPYELNSRWRVVSVFRVESIITLYITFSTTQVENNLHKFRIKNNGSSHKTVASSRPVYCITHAGFVAVFEIFESL